MRCSYCGGSDWDMFENRCLSCGMRRHLYQNNPVDYVRPMGITEAMERGQELGRSYWVQTARTLPMEQANTISNQRHPLPPEFKPSVVPRSLEAWCGSVPSAEGERIEDTEPRTVLFTTPFQRWRW